MRQGFLTRIVVAVAIVAAAVVAASPGARAGDRVRPGAWTTHGPYGGAPAAMSFAPSDASVAYAVDPNDGIFRSTDAGQTWAIRSAQITGATALAVDPADASTLYVAGSSIARSDDGGATWTTLDDGAPASAVAAGGTNGSTVYSASGGDVLRSGDRGATWSTVHVATSGVLTSLVADPSTPGVVWAGGWQTLYRSGDGGRTWAAVLSGLSSAYVRSVALSTTEPGVVYAGTDAGVFRSADGGRRWQSVDGGLPDGSAVDAVAADPGDASTVYAAVSYTASGDGAGIYRTANAAGTWHLREATGGGSPQALAIDLASPDVLLASVVGGSLYRSADEGASWQEAEEGLGLTAVSSIAADPADASHLYAATDHGLYETTTGGRAWQRLAVPPTNETPFGDDIASVAIDPDDVQRVFVATQAGVLISRDGGQTWFATSVTGAMTAVAAGGAGTGVLWAGGYGRVYRSVDDGATWRATGFPPTLPVRAIQPSGQHSGTSLVASELYGVKRTNDGGASWTTATWQDVFALTGDGATVYAGVVCLDCPYEHSAYGVYRSVDAGRTWQQADEGLPTGASVYSLAADAAHPGTVFAGTAGLGVYRSGDGALTWARYGTRLLHPDVRALALDPSGSFAYAGTTGGVFEVALSP